MHWDGTVTLGTLLQILSTFGLAVAVFNAVSARLTVFEHTLKAHADSLRFHAERLDKYDERLLRIVGDLQRVVGRSEIDRRKGYD